MSGWPILSVVTFLPLVGAAFVLAIRGNDEVALRNMRWASLWTTIVTFVLSLLIWYYFDPRNPDFQFVEKLAWLGSTASYHMGVDGISMLFVILTTFLMPICILASWQVSTRLREYLIAFLVLETLMIGVFCALDLVLFYLFF
ncbi:MAG: NADH-quinone oxidoreductase subunit M, partial [Parvibaculaceae bacterium]